PRHPIRRPFKVAPWDATETTQSPSIASAKYSAGPNFRATLTSGLEARISANDPTIAPTNEAVTDRPSATRTFPCRVNAYPSNVVAADAASPGTLIMMALIEPAYVPATWMLASISRPARGFIRNVNGNSMAIAMIGPRPGTTPIHKPPKVDSAMTARLSHWLATTNPCRR